MQSRHKTCGWWVTASAAILWICPAQANAGSLDQYDPLQVAQTSMPVTLEAFVLSVGTNPAEIGARLTESSTEATSPRIPGEVFCDIHQVYETPTQNRFDPLQERGQ